MAYGAIIGQTPTVQASAEMTSYNNDNTSSVITADNVQGAIDQLFTSVSNGKSQIASAITDMGVSTSANDSFAQMATNIGNIETGYDTSQVTATANTVRSGYKFVNSSGQLITGTIPSKGAQTYTPKTVSQTIAKGQYLSGNQTIQGDGNLVPSNIKSGVSIFGVSGTAETIKYKSNEISSIFYNNNKLEINFTSLPEFTNVFGIYFYGDSGSCYGAISITEIEDRYGTIYISSLGIMRLNDTNYLLQGTDNMRISNNSIDIKIMDPQMYGSESIGITESFVLYS